jgi:hypothetical protein
MSDLDWAPELEALNRNLAAAITPLLPEGVGFSLQTFTMTGGPRHIAYISNARREDMVLALRELLNKWESTGIDRSARS